jgi:hypothetical protein
VIHLNLGERFLLTVVIVISLRFVIIIIIFIIIFMKQTLMHLESYDKTGKALFLQTLKLMMSEMKKRYQQVIYKYIILLVIVIY